MRHLHVGLAVLFRSRTPRQSAALTGRGVLLITFCILGSSRAGVSNAEEVMSYRDLPRSTFEAVLGLPGSWPFQTIPFLGDFTFAGPNMRSLVPLPDGIAEVVRTPDGNRLFGMSDHALYELDLAAGEKTRLIEDGVPQISWSMGITYDTTRDRVLLATLGGEGYLYSYTPDSDSWSTVASLSNVDLVAIAYDEPLDRIFGVSFEHNGPCVLYEYNANGAYIRSRPLDVPALVVGYERITQLHVVEDYLAFIQYPEAGGYQPVIHAIDSSTAESWLVVPEPSTLALLCMGIVGLLTYRLRRR